VAWNLGTKKRKPGKTVLRAGAGAFYNHIPLGITLNALRFNGVAQQTFVVANPGFYPVIPSAATLENARQPQQLQIEDAHLQAGQNWQTSVGADRQINKAFRLSANYTVSRGDHLQRVRDINAPIKGLFPFGDSQIRLLSEATGLSRTQQLSVTPSVNYKKLFIAGFYSMSFGKTDAEGQPADPYNRRAEWGPSTYADVRQRAFMFLTTPLPGNWMSKFTLSVNVGYTSASPYNIIIGRDLNGDSIIAERPGLVSGVNAANCTGGTLLFEPAFGCFNLAPAPGASIGRNFARGRSQSILGYASLSRSWILNPTKEASGKETMITVPGPGGTSVQIPASVMNGPAAGAGRRKYNLTFSVNAQNPLNHTTYSTPGGDLSSPYFGVYRSNSFGTTWNRQVNLQLRLNF
jgi:hypothetical protein